MLRACPPPGALTWFFDTNKEPVQRVSDGKVPGQFRDGAWYGLKDWRNKAPTDTDVDAWRKWPEANLCLVTGDAGAFDIDVKIAATAVGAEADRARSLIAAFRGLVAETVAADVDRLPVRWRDNSSSAVIFVRLTERLGKRIFRIIDEAAGHEHAIEFLAAGQQVVIAGKHASGAQIQSSLTTMPLGALPALDAAKLETIVAALPALLMQNGFSLATTARSGAAREMKPPFAPEVALLREIMARRSRWVPCVIPCIAGEHHEWRVSSAELDRDLEEDLSIYTDGIFDHGTERNHSPVSLIREFGMIDECGEISFGGCPTYGAQGGLPFAAVAEPDTSVRRPTEAEALNWLCRRLAGPEFPAYEPTATWKNSSARIARAVGLDWNALRAAQYFEFVAGDDPTSWSSTEQLIAHADTLAALQVLNPPAFEFMAELATAGPDKIAMAISDRRDALASGHVAEEPQQTVRPDIEHGPPEPVDIFGDADPADLSTLPADCLPDVIQRWVTSECRRKGVAEPFGAIAAIAVAAAAIGTSLMIQPRKKDTGWREPAALWVSLVAEPGRTKSAIIAAAVEPLRKYDRELYRQDKVVHDLWAAATAEKKRSKNAPDPGKEPIIRRTVIDDITTEKQLRIHEANPHGLLRAPDELVSFFSSFGAYKKGSDGDRTQALRFFEGSEITVDRIGGGTIHADKALMGIVAGTQPDKLRDLVRGLGSDGMLQRFIFVLDDGMRRRGADESPDEQTLAEYARVIRSLASADHGDARPLRMSPSGQKAFEDAMERISTLEDIPSLASAWRGHVGKWGKLLPRIVLTFHAIQAVSTTGMLDPRAPIELDTVQRAIRFSQLLLRHGLRFYEDYFSADGRVTNARALAGFFLTRPDITKVSHRDLGEIRKELRGPDPRKRVDAMRELENAGWCSVAEQGAGHPERWTIDERIHTRFNARALREIEERGRRREAIMAAGETRKWINTDGMSDGMGV